MDWDFLIFLANSEFFLGELFTNIAKVVKGWF